MREKRGREGEREGEREKERERERLRAESESERDCGNKLYIHEHSRHLPRERHSL